jgi:hypothetical protein
MVSPFKGKTQADGDWEQSSEWNSWIKEEDGEESGNICIMTSFIFVLFTNNFWASSFKENGMGRACSKHVRGKKCTNFIQCKSHTDYLVIGYRPTTITN